jgi:hypothetical protein
MNDPAKQRVLNGRFAFETIRLTRCAASAGANAVSTRRTGLRSWRHVHRVRRASRFDSAAAVRRCRRRSPVTERSASAFPAPVLEVDAELA